VRIELAGDLSVGTIAAEQGQQTLKEASHDRRRPAHPDAPVRAVRLNPATTIR
jgi:hypothetical protein